MNTLDQAPAPATHEELLAAAAGVQQDISTLLCLTGCLTSLADTETGEEEIIKDSDYFNVFELVEEKLSKTAGKLDVGGFVHPGGGELFRKYTMFEMSLLYAETHFKMLKGQAGNSDIDRGALLAMADKIMHSLRDDLGALLSTHHPAQGSARE